MAIRLSSNCGNCSQLTNDIMCSIHKVKVNESYTCDRFEGKSDFYSDRQCTSCSRYGNDSCAHPNKATEGMLCSSWAPKAAV